MSLQTAKTRGAGGGGNGSLVRPSFSQSISSSSPSNFGASVNRKASYQALTGDPRTPSTASRMAAGSLEVGDAVNVPGDMYGVVTFVGSVRGKNGTFVGVELDARFAMRGKNSGDVDGVKYFNTTVPGAGIFLPIHRAEKRSISTPSDSFGAPSPNTPTYSTVNGIRTNNSHHTPPTPAPASITSSHHKLSQTVGPGTARPTSPNFKPKRPSLPRPESPFRKPAPNLAPPTSTPGRQLSQSTRGSTNTTPRPTPGRGAGAGGSNFKSSTMGGRPPPPRPYSRTGSRLGNRRGEDEDGMGVGAAITSNSRTASQSSVPSFSQPLRSPSRLGSAGGSQQEQELSRLKSQLAERDRRLEEQAASLAEMEASVKELSSFLPGQDGAASVKSPPAEEAGAEQLRQLLREKNEKISLLTHEFDAHRADFRSTLDSLEMASTETERVYEEQKKELVSQIERLQEEVAAAREEASGREDIEGITLQLKQLEELVAELEEGLEESRRGEAEARGEVEFLRGEVERGRSELRREREKGGSGDSGVREKEDEIRGLKAIIHSFTSGEGSNGAADANETTADALEEMEKLQVMLEDSRQEKEALEVEVEKLRRDAEATMMNGIGSESERTDTAPAHESGRPSSKTRAVGDSSTAGLIDRTSPPTTNGAGTVLFCEMCESRDHDTLECTKLRSDSPYSPGKENEGSAYQNANGKVEQKVQEDEDKWCALCEKDGHLAFDCPEEQY
ncbi:hypothetical protein LTR37_012823 [Vermiconidia calcicola]|uniref:Uncharacterized protein n=1 Tax=Vermiconidia calcicola TaxID=1690605 RepID=A0ACC3MYC1_9PEZI|nr:hypothetical protein LTR37_012823 [Vermiconidia calcicola]